MGNQCVHKWGCRLLAFILSPQIHDFYQPLPEACEDPLTPLHIEQQLIGNQKRVLLKGFIKKKQCGILLCGVSAKVDSLSVLLNHCVLRKADILMNEAIRRKVLHGLMMQVIVSVTKIQDWPQTLPPGYAECSKYTVWWVIQPITLTHHWRGMQSGVGFSHGSI